MSLSYREIEYYISFESNKLYNNIILKEWNNLLENYAESYQCAFIYCSYIDSSNLLLLFKTSKNEYCVVKNKNFTKKGDSLEDEFKKIQNELNNIEEEKSVINLECFSNIVDAVDNGFSKKERKDMNICSTKSMKLSNVMKQELMHENFVDFISIKSSDDYIMSLKNYVDLCNDSLNLALFSNLKSEYLNSLSSNENVKSINLNSNNIIDSLNWVTKFPKIENLTISFCDNIDDQCVEKLSCICSNLKNISFYNCEKISLISLKYILQNISIESVSFINPNMDCGKPLSPLVSEQDWKILYDQSGAKSVENIYIDTVYLCKDTCNDMIQCCRNLQKLVLNSEIYSHLINDVHDGYNKNESIVICNHTYSEKRVFRKSVSISRLKRDSIQPAFSDSMLRIIQQNKNKK